MREEELYKKKAMTMEEAIQGVLTSEEDIPPCMMLEIRDQNILEWEMTKHPGRGL